MFSQLIGNQNVKDSLAQLLRNERVPNSLLFMGPDGVGKKQFAVELARAFVCQTGNSACGTCSACKRVGVFNTPTSEKGDDYEFVFFGEHPDVGIVIPFKRNVRVDAIRALEVQANFRPYEVRARVFIINDADKMNDAASNALLKTLEEPPSTTYLILVTSRPDALLSTIRSRCQTIRFAPVAETEIEDLLIDRREFTPTDAKLAARIANGRVAAALAIDLDKFRAQRSAQISVIEKAFINIDRAALLRAAEQLNDSKNKDLFEENLSVLEMLMRDLWTIKNGTRPEALRNFDIAEELTGISGQVTTHQLEKALTEIELLRQSLAVNINRKSAADALFMKVAA
ncbi:MAG: ATP-binding protein [Pyrinomonadaceae bacterium]